jgi:hypothetical protein
VSINPVVYFEGGDQAFLESHPYFIIKKVSLMKQKELLFFGLVLAVIWAMLVRIAAQK